MKLLVVGGGGREHAIIKMGVDIDLLTSHYLTWLIQVLTRLVLLLKATINL